MIPVSQASVSEKHQTEPFWTKPVGLSLSSSSMHQFCAIKQIKTLVWQVNSDCGALAIEKQDGSDEW